MTSLPIVERELRVRARQPGTHRSRLIAAGAAFTVVLLLYLAGGAQRSGGSQGVLIFRLLAWMAFLFCLFEGSRTTADSLSREKREGTLGLLFLTDLRSYDLVLGKMVASSLNSLYCLLAILPPMAIPLLIGGVLFEEFWRLVLVLLSTLFLSLSAGMAVSAFTRREQRSGSRVSQIVAVLGMLPGLSLLSPTLGQSWVCQLSPTTGLLQVMDAEYTAAPERFWASIGCAHFLAWAFLAGATFLLPRRWQDPVHSHPAPGGGWLRRWLGRLAPEDRSALRQRMILDGNPAIWLVVRGQRQLWILWTLVIGVSAVASATLVLAGGANWMGLGLLGVFLLLHLALASWVGTEACHLLPAARDSGALEVLLCTPLTSHQIVEGHLIGLKQRFLQPVAVLAAVEAILLAGQLHLMSVRDGIPPFAAATLAALVVLCLGASLLDLVAVARYGIWQGLAQRHTSRAVSRTLLRILLLPAAAALFFGPGYPLVSLVKNLIVINHAQRQMRYQFRSLLALRYGTAAEGEPGAAAASKPKVEPLPNVCG